MVVCGGQSSEGFLVLVDQISDLSYIHLHSSPSTGIYNEVTM